MNSISQLGGGWGGFGGHQQGGQQGGIGGVGGPGGYNGGFPGQRPGGFPGQRPGGFPGRGRPFGYGGGFPGRDGVFPPYQPGNFANQGGFPALGRPVFDYASQHFPQSANYGGPSSNYGNNGPAPVSNSLPRPSDPQEFASYLQAQLAGGTLEGKTTVNQSDAIPGTRFGQVEDSTQWHASLARNYAYQFAAYANGDNPLSAEGVAKGADAFDKMKPEAQLFMQVASVFKGNLLDGPGFYDNPGLKSLLESKGLNDLASGEQVGKTDVQSIGAIASAINSGDLTLNEVINSGTISDMDRYHEVISYVSNGTFANDLNAYDNASF